MLCYITCYFYLMLYNMLCLRYITGYVSYITCYVYVT